jgi:hypothetical protein
MRNERGACAIDQERKAQCSNPLPESPGRSTADAAMRARWPAGWIAWTLLRPAQHDERKERKELAVAVNASQA